MVTGSLVVSMMTDVEEFKRKPYTVNKLEIVLFQTQYFEAQIIIYTCAALLLHIKVCYSNHNVYIQTAHIKQHKRTYALIELQRCSVKRLQNSKCVLQQRIV